MLHRNRLLSIFIVAAPLISLWPSAALSDELGSGTARETGQVATSIEDSDASSGSSLKDRFSLNHFSIFYGPALENASAYQVTPKGKRDLTRPILFKNYETLSYALNNEMGLSGTAYWVYVPVQGQLVELRDPYIRLSHSSIFNSGPWNLYGDLRLHFPISDPSRLRDMLSGIQVFQALTFTPEASRFGTGVYTNVRFNIYGARGYGNDVELYAAPFMQYQVSPTIALVALYEMGASHTLGAASGKFDNDGTDLEPGISWDITPTFNFSPYLHVNTGESISATNTSVGLTLSWTLL